MCGCADVRMCRCADMRMCKCGDVQMCGCANVHVRMYKCEDSFHFSAYTPTSAMNCEQTATATFPTPAINHQLWANCYCYCHIPARLSHSPCCPTPAMNYDL